MNIIPPVQTRSISPSKPASQGRLPEPRSHRARAKILVVDDSQDCARLLQSALEPADLRVLTVPDAEQGLRLLRSERPDLVILDIVLPGMDGFELLRLIRQQSDVPVILLSAKRREADRVKGLRLGADDYVVKPFSLGELQARVDRLLRQTAAREDEDSQVLSTGEVRLDVARHEVTVKGQPARLSPKEFELLKRLLEVDGEVLSRDQLLKGIWGHGPDVEIETRTVDQHVARLRRKLGPAGTRIATVHNFGYQIKR